MLAVTRVRHSVAAFAALALVIGGLAVPVGVPTVVAAACQTGVAGAIGTTTTFSGCSGEQSYVVPAGVTKVRAKVIGAHGGDRFGLGGIGGQVDAIIDVTAGSTLYVLVGGRGEDGGFNGGGSGIASNTVGGGASDIRTTSCSSSCPGAVGSATLASRVVVGGGGGGAGPCGTTGGAGGGQANGDGNSGGLCASDAGPAAQGGTQSAGGTTDGVQGTGGDAANGGGGGGGLYGGGGAIGTRGGGGGSSFGPVGATFSTTGTAAQVQITPFVATTTAVTSTPSATNYGESVTFTATITYSGSATGTVQFYDGAGTLGSPRPVSGNAATLTTTALGAGSHTITAVYSGDTGAAGSTSPDFPYTVGRQATKTTTTSGLNPSLVGDSVTFTATVTPSAGSQPIEAGSVQFFDGSTPIGGPVSINTSTGQATLSTSALNALSHVMSARWIGSPNFAPTADADATPVTQVVNKIGTTTSLVSALNPSEFGTSVTFTATVTPTTGTLDGGTVQFYDDTTPVGSPVSVNTTTGQAAFTTSTLALGSHTIRADYGGTSTFATSTASGVQSVIAKPPTIAKAFGVANIPLNGTTGLTFTLTNPNASAGLTGIGFTDSLPTGLVVATPNGLSGTCGGGTITATAGSGSIGLSGATLAAGASCTFSVTVKGTTAGPKHNTVTATSTESGPGTAGTADITVAAPPTIAKTFGAASIGIGYSTSLSFTLANPNSTVALTGVGFSDTLPTGLVVATPNGLTGSCGGGTITAIAGSGSVTLTGATLAASSSCTFSVNVTGTTAGSKVNTTSVVSSANGGSGTKATATLAVLLPDLSITSHHAGSFRVGRAGTWTLHVANAAGAGPTKGTVSVTDYLSANLPLVSATGSGWTCATSGVNVTCTRSDALAGGAAYPDIAVTVRPTSKALGLAVNIARVTTANEVNLADNTATDPTTILP